LRVGVFVGGLLLELSGGLLLWLRSLIIDSINGSPESLNAAHVLLGPSVRSLLSIFYYGAAILFTIGFATAVYGAIGSPVKKRY